MGSVVLGMVIIVVIVSVDGFFGVVFRVIGLFLNVVKSIGRIESFVYEWLYEWKVVDYNI